MSRCSNDSSSYGGSAQCNKQHILSKKDASATTVVLGAASASAPWVAALSWHVPIGECVCLSCLGAVLLLLFAVAARRATDDDKKKLIDSVDCFIFDCDGEQLPCNPCILLFTPM